MKSQANRRRAASGYVLLAALLLAALISVAVASYARLALESGTDAHASEGRLAERAVLDSGLALADASLRAGTTGTTRSLVAPSGESVVVSVGKPAAGRSSLSVEATTGGRTRNLKAVAELHGVDDGSLPTLTAEARSAILATAGLTKVTSDTRYEDQVLDGLLLVSKGKKLTLEDSVLRGAIISENALSDAVWRDSDRIEIELKGSVSIQSTVSLEGCAIVAPDAKLTLGSDQRLQVRGALVVREFDVSDSDAMARLSGPFRASQTKGMSGRIVQLGLGRAPLAWPAALANAGQGISRVSFELPQVSDAERAAIRGFDFAAWKAGRAGAP